MPIIFIIAYFSVKGLIMLKAVLFPLGEERFLGLVDEEK